MLHKSRQSHLHGVRQSFKARNSEELAVGCFHSQVEVFTRENYLQEVLVVQEASLVSVKEVNQLLAVLLGELHNAIVPQKIQNILAVEVFFSCSVDSHEGTVRTEVRIADAQSLPQLLGGDLAFHYFDE